MASSPTLSLELLTEEAYRSFGEVISPRDGLSLRSANQGTAQRFLDVAHLQDLRPGRARPHLSIYRCDPRCAPLPITVLERHAHATQLFVPLRDDARYLSVVAPPGPTPDLTAIRVFEVRGRTGITYHPGVWHHPLITLDQVTDFLCLVWEDGTSGDCEEVSVIEGPILSW
jgi:ureidoglycolate lyase